MNKRNLSLILLLLAISALFAGNAYSQNTELQNTESQNTESVAAKQTAKAEVMSENDSLPFMQNRESAETSQPGTGSLLLKTIGAMLLIVGLLFFGAWGLKKAGFDRFGKQNADGGTIDLAVISSVSTGNGQTISAVRFGERILLVGSTAQNFTLLADEDVKDVPNIKTSRSVADLLGEEKSTFGNEFELAQNRLDVWEEQGEMLK